MLDVNKLTLGEVAKVEELSGHPISAIGDEDKPKGLALAALAFVAKRRQDPKFSWNDAQGLTFDEANEILGFGQDDQEDQDAGPLDSGSPTPKAVEKKPATRKK